MKWERATDLERKDFIFDIILKRVIFKFRYFTLFETIRITRYSEKFNYCFKYHRHVGYSNEIIEIFFRNESILYRFLKNIFSLLSRIVDKEESILDFEKSKNFDRYCDKFVIGQYFTRKSRDNKLKELGI